MTKSEFLDTLHRRLAGLPPSEIDDVMADYAQHFADGLAAGRSEAEIAEALGDPRAARPRAARRGGPPALGGRAHARQLLRRPGRLPRADRGGFRVPAAAGGGPDAVRPDRRHRVVALCVAGLALLAKLFSWEGAVRFKSITRILYGVGLLGVGIGGGALLLMMVDYVVRLLGRYARLHYALLEQGRRRQSEESPMKTLGWIAVGGLGIGIASLSLAYALGGRDSIACPSSLRRACGDGAKAARQFVAWHGTMATPSSISLPGTVHFRGGQGSEHRRARIARPRRQCRGERQSPRARLPRMEAGRDLEITLPGRAFRDIRIAGSGKLVMENVSQPDLDLRISGSGTVRAQGSVDQADDQGLGVRARPGSATSR